MNNVGLVTVKSSRALIYDTTPPCASRVYDGRKPDHGTLDLDYTSNYTHLSAHWDSFSDPHSGVSSYDWSLGTCKGCTDIMEYINVGLLTSMLLDIYYSRVVLIDSSGCNHTWFVQTSFSALVVNDLLQRSF